MTTTLRQSLSDENLSPSPHFDQSGIVPERPWFAREGVNPMTAAFARKAAIHPGAGAQQVPEDERHALFNTLIHQPRTSQTAAYFHVPFCETRCAYCGFFNRFLKPEDSRLYTNALMVELELESDTAAVCSYPIHAVYFGGGTPTSLEASDIYRLLNAVRTYLPLANDCEITMEGRIHHFTPEKMRACIDGGVNRFSIGVQSFDTKIRRSMGRIDNRQTVLETLDTLCAYDQASVVVDLVYGFPGQTLELWEDDVRMLNATKIDGADLYQLNILPHTTLAAKIKSGEIPPSADITLQAAMFSRGVEIMQEQQWRRLSVSHWGRGNRERSLYNRLVKSGAHILAYGCGAGGNLHQHGYFVDRDVDRYLHQVAAGFKPILGMARPNPYAKALKIITDGFDTGALNLSTLSQALAVESEMVFQPLLEQWERCALVRRQGEFLTLTRAGEFWQVNLAQGMMDYFQHQNSKE